MKRGHYLLSAVVLFLVILYFFLMEKKKKAVESLILHNEEQSFLEESDKGEDAYDAVHVNYPLPEDRGIGIQSYHTEQEKIEKRKWYAINRYGAEAKLTFHVTDSEGRHVPNASFHTGFIFNETSFTVVEGKTDENGLFVAEGKTSYDVNYLVQKENYYQTSSTLYFSKRGGNDVINGKWQPWNPTIEITLKKKRNPIPMYARNIDIILPTQNDAIGFDFYVGDLVVPHGKGESADILLNCGGERPMPINRAVSRNLTVSFAQDGEGIIRANKYIPSVLRSLHEAPETGYQPQVYFNYSRTVGEILEDNNLPENEYLIFRTRVERDENGRIVKSNYGKIYSIDYDITGKPDTRARVSLVYYFNPTPNDRNIEFDTSQNLFGNDRRNRVSLP